MKVAQINATYGIGSTGKICTSISELLFGKGIENVIFYTQGKRKEKHGANYSFGWYKKIQSLKSRILGNWGFNSNTATLILITKLKQFEPDVIVLHNIHSHDCNLSLLFRYIKKHKIKVVWTFHDCWAFTGYCTHFQISGCEKWKTGCGSCEAINRRPYSWLFDRSEEMLNRKKKLFTSTNELHIITPSAWLADLVKQSFLSEYPVTVINNGIDLSVFKPTPSAFREKHNIDNRPMVLGVAAIWSNRKGLDVFIELAKTHNEWNYVLVGTDDAVDKLLPPNIVSIHRTTNQAELAEIYSAADVFLNPTLEDNYPTVNMEAIACGTPVITYKTGGSPEIIGKGCGTVVTKGDIEAVVSAISALGCSETYSVEACLERAKCFDSNFCYQQYLNLFVDMETKQ